jgi:hypothetical protein
MYKALTKLGQSTTTLLITICYVVQKSGENKKKF